MLTHPKLPAQPLPEKAAAPDPEAPQICFEGDWTTTERRILTGAIADTERLYASTTALDLAPRPWLCYCKRLSGVAVYVAHRAGWGRILHAYAAIDLGLKILFIGDQSPDGQGGFSA